MSQISLYKILNKIFFVTFIFLNLQNISSAYEQVQIDYPDKSANQPATSTYYFKGTNSKALILFLPGGDGVMIGGGMDAFSLPFRMLTDKSMSQGKYDFVSVNSNKSLQTRKDRDWLNNVYQLRSEKDHIIRVESVINYYKSKTKLPIILFGHSNGGVSVEILLNHLTKENKINTISGILISETNDTTAKEIRAIITKPEINLPTIIMLHKKTRCETVNYNYQISQFEKNIENHKSPIAIISIEGGIDLPSHPCYSGFHMYAGADKEVLEKIEIQLNKIKFK
jgi:hypothetical protein